MSLGEEVKQRIVESAENAVGINPYTRFISPEGVVLIKAEHGSWPFDYLDSNDWTREQLKIMYAIVVGSTFSSISKNTHDIPKDELIPSLIELVRYQLGKNPYETRKNYFKGWDSNEVEKLKREATSALIDTIETLDKMDIMDSDISGFAQRDVVASVNFFKRNVSERLAKSDLSKLDEEKRELFSEYVSLAYCTYML